MKTFARLSAVSLVLVLVACGSDFQEQDPGPKPDAPNQPDPPKDNRPDISVQVDTDVSVDAGTPDASEPQVDSGEPTACTPQPTLGHCLTNMATLCYETSYDATSECMSSGMPSGWFPGTCDVTRSTGGCYVNCETRYHYPLGGGQPTVKMRLAEKEACENVFHGVYIDTTPTLETDGGTDTDYDSGSY